MIVVFYNSDVVSMYSIYNTMIVLVHLMLEYYMYLCMMLASSTRNFLVSL